MPEVSVVMSVFNGEEFIHEAVHSILSQTFTNLEFIIINDGSTDNTPGIIRSFSDPRIILVDQENTGLAMALNRGIAIASGKYIARMDGDDISLPGRIEMQHRFLEGSPGYVLVGSNAELTEKDGRSICFSDVPASWEEIETRFPYPPIFHPSVMFRKDISEKCGNYDAFVSRFNTLEDILLWNKMKKYGKMANLPDILIKYRISPFASSLKIGRFARITRQTIESILQNGSLDPEVEQNFLETRASLSDGYRWFAYNLYVAKKLIFDNYQPRRAREKILSALKIKPFDPTAWILLMLSISPRFITRRVIKNEIRN